MRELRLEREGGHFMKGLRYHAKECQCYPEGAQKDFKARGVTWLGENHFISSDPTAVSED